MNDMPLSDQDAFGADSQLRIEVHAGPLAGKGYPFTVNALTFGRATDNDIVLDDGQVSRYHAILRNEGGEVIIQDLDSMNGVLVNGERIPGSHILQPTETITIGASVFGVTGFPAPSTISMEAQLSPNSGGAAWSTYQSGPNMVPQTNQGSSNWLLWSGLLLLLALIVAIGAIAYFVFGSTPTSPTQAVLPAVVISSPVTGSLHDVGRPVNVQATANDPSSGVVVMELWIAGNKVAESSSPVASGQSPFTAVMEWTPPAAGDFTLEIRAINAAGLRSAPTLVNITVRGNPTPLSQPVPVEDTPTPTDEGIPNAAIQTDLNVRSGPGTVYEVLGLLKAGSTVEIVGKTSDESWWYIVYPTSPDQRGWISAEFAPANNAAGVPIANTPTPQPTDIPTATTVPNDTATPTQTPTVTATPIDTPTATLTPTLTPTVSIEPNISFSADPTSINEGDCTKISWLVTNVQAVFFQGDGVSGDNGGQPVTREECPDETKTFTLRVTRMDNQDQSQDIEITVRQKPAAPTDLEVTDVLTESMNLSWQDASNSEEGFRIYDADENKVLDTFGDDATSGTVPDLTCGTTYRLYLVAYNDVGESRPSNTVTEETRACP